MIDESTNGPAAQRSAVKTQAALPALTIRALSYHEAQQVPEIWNAAWHRATPGPNPYPLSPAIWAQRLASRHHEPTLLLGGFVDERLVAVAYAKLPRSAWQAPNAAWLSLLAVTPEFQGRGLGTAISGRLLRLLSERGATVIKFGGDADHLLPGPPQESGQATWRLLRHHGASFGAAEHDLHLDLGPEPPAANLPAGWCLRTDDPQGAVAFVTGAFPGRWAEELVDYFAGGAIVMTLEREATATSTAPAEVKGFCAIFLGGEKVVSPGLIWGAAFRQELEASGSERVSLAGIGPLGIAPEVRGSGLGEALVRGAANYVRNNGGTDLIINWTSLTAFYGRLGARLWRSYQRAEAPLLQTAAQQQAIEVSGNHDATNAEEGTSDAG